MSKNKDQYYAEYYVETSDFPEDTSDWYPSIADVLEGVKKYSGYFDYFIVKKVSFHKKYVKDFKEVK